MTASELVTRTAEAATPELVAQLVSDLKAHKDEQLSDLTLQVNAANKLATDAKTEAESLATEVEKLKAEATEAAVSIEALTTERDTLAADLAGRIAAQDDLALRAKSSYDAAAKAFADFGAILGEALTPAEQKAAAEREALRAKLQAELDALK